MLPRTIRQLVRRHRALAADALFEGSAARDASDSGGKDKRKRKDKRKTKLGRGAAGKALVFGLLKHGGKLNAVVMGNARKEACVRH